MESSILKKAGRFLREQAKNKRWRRVLTVLGAVVVFVTAYVLLMPAVALEQKQACELEEHTHTEECYGQILACGKVGVGDETEAPVTLEYNCTFLEELHAHTRECYDREENLVCGYADYAVHEHKSGCYEDGRLVCSLPEIEEHEHTEACYRINDSGYICGQEESEAHEHTDSCYTEYKELSCERAESEGHTHVDSCYAEEWKLACDLEEGEDHTHDEVECYELAKELICAEEESEGHQHDKSCYTVDRELTCGKEENLTGHKHTESCRGVVKELACEKDEVILHEHSIEDDCYEPVLNEKGEQAKDENGELLWTLVCEQLEVVEHVHGEECYEEHVHTEECYEEGLICGKEEHVHTEECGDRDITFYCAGRIHAHTEECYDSDGNVVCGFEDFVIHTHDESCFDEKETLICPLPEITEHVHTEECYNEEGSLICQLPEVSLHTHTEICYDAEGILICGKLEVREHHHSEACHSQEAEQEEEQEQLYTKTCEGDGYVVTVTYRKDANIPEEAKLVAEQITQEENEAHYAERQAQFQKTLKDEGATIRALLKIGFYLDGEEIEPESDITVTVQLLDEDGLAEGGPVTVVHFAKDETEVLDGSRVKDSSTTFQMGSFSEIAIGYRTGEEESAGIYVSQRFEYEDDAYHMTFYIEGNAQFLDKEEEILSAEEDVVEGGDEEQAEEPEESYEDSGENEIEAPDGETDSEEEETSEEELVMDEIPEPGEEEAALFEFQVRPLERGSEEYDAFLAHALENQGLERLVSMQVFDYSLTYGGKELDLTNCEVTVEITTAPALERQVERSIPEAVIYLMNYKPEADLVQGEISEETAEPDALSDEEPQAVEDEASGEEVSDEIVSDEEPQAVEDEVLEEETADEEPQAVEDEVSEEETAEEEANVSLQDEALEMPEETEFIISIAGMVASAPAANGAVVQESLQIDSLGGMLCSNDGIVASIAEQKVRTTVDGPVSLNVIVPQNPNFTVQYYANLTVLANSGTTALSIIDTSGSGDGSGGKLPENKGNISTVPTGNDLKEIYLDAHGTVLTEEKPVEVYASRSFEYYKAPTINYINVLIEKTDNYTIKELWLLKSGKNAESTVEDDWQIFAYNSSIHFANRWPRRDRTEEEKPGEIAFDASAEIGTEYISEAYGLVYTKTSVGYTTEDIDKNGKRIGNIHEYMVITEGAVLRLVYDTEKNDIDFAASFYDYDISNGWIYRARPPENQGPGYYQHKTAGDTFSGDSLKEGILTWASGLSNWDKHLYTYTQEQGINSSGNYYNGSGTKLAFGNVNTGTGLGRLTWSNNELNKYNNKGYQGCTFGLVTGMSNGKIQYASGIQAPNLFNEVDLPGKTTSGKTEYNDYSLKFNRVGDTYTLTAVNGTGATNLGEFNNPTSSTGKHTSIWTNNFWPMDSAPSFGTGTHDVKFGGTDTFKGGTHEIRFGPISQKGTDYTFPESDDGKYHNSYFGMRYEVPFELSADYVGPLEYYFFGDDDMWVFLDGKLVCDIGGVHSSVGEYVNLWDYLKKGEAGKHMLSFFYTERGASGSTCWMQFTLPSTTSLTPETTEKDYGSLRVEKEVGAISNLNQQEVDGWDSGDGFDFTIELKDKDGKRLQDDFSYSRYDKDGNEITSGVIDWDGVIWNGAEFHLRNGEYIIVKYLPAGTQYTIVEKNGATKYKTVKNADGKEEAVADGSSNLYYYTDIIVDNNIVGERLTDDSKIEQDGEEDVPIERKAEGSIAAAGQGEVKYINRVLIYELPESGGPGTNLYTMAGIGLLLIACLMYRKKFKEGGKRSSAN